MSYHDRYRNERSAWLKPTLIVAAIIALIALVLLAWTDSWHIVPRALQNHIMLAWFFPGGSTITPFLAWCVFAAIALIIAVNNKRHDSETTVWQKNVAVIGLVVLIIPSFVTSFLWDEIGSRYYNQSSTYVVSSTDDVPDTLARVATSSSSQINISEGEMPTSWVPRIASATGATYVMEKTGDSNANTALMPETISYIYGEGASGTWTAIRNGKNRQPIFGVASWAGTGERVVTCEFEGDYELRYAFNGVWGMNLGDEIAAYDSRFEYDADDVYGYCDDGKPVIVIPGTRSSSTGTRSVNVTYGVMTITGSVSGQPVIDFTQNVNPGDLPGPVYPARLVNSQLEALSWSAGRVWFWLPPVGFAPTDTASQEGNNKNFLLKDSRDGRLYWVTPMKPISTDSQTLVAYSVTAADELTFGQFNQQLVYVLNSEDSRIVNLNDLENAVTQAVAESDPGFFTGSDENIGKIVEFIPTSDTSWQVFAERGGRAVYRIDVSGGERMRTTVVSLGEDGTEESVRATPSANTGGDSSSTDCGGDISLLSDAELAGCLRKLTDELVSRQVPSS